MLWLADLYDLFKRSGSALASGFVSPFQNDWEYWLADLYYLFRRLGNILASGFVSPFQKDWEYPVQRNDVRF